MRLFNKCCHSLSREKYSRSISHQVVNTEEPSVTQNKTKRKWYKRIRVSLSQRKSKNGSTFLEKIHLFKSDKSVEKDRLIHQKTSLSSCTSSSCSDNQQQVSLIGRKELELHESSDTEVVIDEIESRLQSNAFVDQCDIIEKQNSANYDYETNTKKPTSALTVTKQTLLEIDPKNTPLHCACYLHENDEIHQMLQMDSSLCQVSNGNGELPLHYACLDPSGANDRIIDALLASYPQSAMCENCDRSLPLHLACMVGAPSLYVIQALLYANPTAALLQSEFTIDYSHITAGEVSNDGDHDCNTTLSSVVKENPGCSVDNFFGALHLFYKHKCSAQCDEKRNYRPPSYGNVRFGNDCSPQPLQSHGLEQGWSALHLAALSGACPAVLEVLIEYGPNMINTKTSQGRTPLHCAMEAVNKNIKGAENTVHFLENYSKAKKTSSNDRVSIIKK